MNLTEHLASSSEATLSHLSELNGLRLSPHFTLGEMTVTKDSEQDFDELLIERSPKGTYWVHFAVRPSGNRRKIKFLQT